jgi:integrase
VRCTTGGTLGRTAWSVGSHELCRLRAETDAVRTESNLGLDAAAHVAARSRNTRLAALRSLFGYAALRHPEHAELIRQVLAIPPKRFDKTTVPFLNPDEVSALLSAPDLGRWEGRRDRALLALAVQTGLRLSELIGLNCGDVELGASPHAPGLTAIPR